MSSGSGSKASGVMMMIRGFKELQEHLSRLILCLKRSQLRDFVLRWPLNNVTLINLCPGAIRIHCYWSIPGMSYSFMAMEIKL